MMIPHDIIQVLLQNILHMISFELKVFPHLSLTIFIGLFHCYQDGPKADLEKFSTKIYYKSALHVKVTYFNNSNGEQRSITLQNLKTVGHLLYLILNH